MKKMGKKGKRRINSQRTKMREIEEGLTRTSSERSRTQPLLSSQTQSLRNTMCSLLNL